MYRLRVLTAYLSRLMPDLRGKRRLGNMLSKFLTNFDSDRECIEKIEMKDKSLMLLDVRSRSEQKAYWTGKYDDEMIFKLSNCLKENCTVLDVGANIGFYSVALGQKVKKLNGRLYAFEPVRSNSNRLVDNIALNQLEKNVLPCNIALGNEEASVEVSMENTNNSTTGNAVIITGDMPDNHFGANSQVSIMRLDTFAKKQNINDCDLIKIDVEGAEVMFLQGGKHFICENRPIIFGEFNNYFMPKFGHTFMDVVDIFSTLDYRFFKLSKHNQFDEIKEFHSKLENVLLVPSEKSSQVVRQMGIVV